MTDFKKKNKKTLGLKHMCARSFQASQLDFSVIWVENNSCLEVPMGWDTVTRAKSALLIPYRL